MEFVRSITRSSEVRFRSRQRLPLQFRCADARHLAASSNVAAEDVDADLIRLLNHLAVLLASADDLVLHRLKIRLNRTLDKKLDTLLQLLHWLPDRDYPRPCFTTANCITE
jgi:hypothetical protein